MLYISKAGVCVYIYYIFPTGHDSGSFLCQVSTLFGGQRTLKSGKEIRDYRIRLNNLE